MDLEAFPTDAAKSGSASVDGSMSIWSFGLDLTLRVINEINVGNCLVPKRTLVFATIRTSDITATALAAAQRRGLAAGAAEFRKRSDEFIDQLHAGLVEASEDCLRRLLESLATEVGKKALFKVRLALIWAAWIPVVIYDYLRLQGSDSSLSLIYTSPTPVDEIQWDNREYEVVCRDVAPRSFKVKLNGGRGRGGPPGGRQFDVSIVGDPVLGDLIPVTGPEAAVLLSCTPAPGANYFATEIQVFRAGSALAGNLTPRV
jgi:hypothetical protein